MSHTHDHICWGGGHHHCGGHELSVRHVSADYGNTPALEDISFSARCGQTLALMGPNGAGKSTLLGILAGVVRQKGGEVLWNSRPLADTRHEVAFLPQRSEVDWSFPISVRQLVEMGRYPSTGMWGPLRAHDREIVEKALEAMRLQDLQHRQIGALSGGQQQRAFLARSLAQEAHILLLDEPFTGLDAPGVAGLSKHLRALAEEGRLVIASHHDLASAPGIFDACLLLRRTAIAYGPTAGVLTRANLGRAFGKK